MNNSQGKVKKYCYKPKKPKLSSIKKAIGDLQDGVKSSPQIFVILQKKVLMDFIKAS